MPSTELESNTIIVTFKCLLYVIRHPKGTLKHLEISQCYNFCHMHYSSGSLTFLVDYNFNPNLKIPNYNKSELDEYSRNLN